MMKCGAIPFSKSLEDTGVYRRVYHVHQLHSSTSSCSNEFVAESAHPAVSESDRRQRLHLLSLSDFTHSS